MTYMQEMPTILANRGKAPHVEKNHMAAAQVTSKLGLRGAESRLVWMSDKGRFWGDMHRKRWRERPESGPFT